MNNVKEFTRDEIIFQKDEISNLTVVRWIKTTANGQRCAMHCKHHWLYENGVHYCKLFNEAINNLQRVDACRACKRVDTSKLPRTLYV